MYSDKFGLTGRPFQLTPDPRFYFESASHRKALAYLGYGLAQGEGFIIVTGEIGAGKTTLVAHLLDTIDRNLVNAVGIVSTQVEGDDMLRMAALALGLPVDGTDKAQLLARIEAFVAERGRAGQKTLLIVDEAQNLPISSLEELRMLSNFQVGGQSMLQIFLLGQPEFRERLNDPEQLEQLRQRVIATHHLTAMTEDEVGAYIMHRMKCVGWAGTPAFDDSAFGAIYRYSGGIPRKVNTLMSRVLLMASLDEVPVIDRALVDAVLADLGSEESMSELPVQGALKLVEKSSGGGPEAQALDLGARVAVLEAQLAEQGEALQRVLTLLVDWVEADEARGSGDIRQVPAA